VSATGAGEGAASPFAYTLQKRKMIVGCLVGSGALPFALVTAKQFGYLSAYSWWGVLGLTFLSVIVGIAYARNLSQIWHARVRDLGTISVDADGLRFEATQGAVLYPWGKILDIELDRPHRIACIHHQDGRKLLVADVGFAKLERFEELCVQLGGHAPVRTFDPRSLKALGRHTVTLGLATALAGLLLFCSNLWLRFNLGWERGTWGFPCLLGAMGLLYGVAGARLLLNRGPLTAPSQLAQGPGKLAAYIIVVAVVNALLIAMLNASFFKP
jgi:hypothetical protein